jgi:hypothetical protein
MNHVTKHGMFPQIFIYYIKIIFISPQKNKKKRKKEKKKRKKQKQDAVTLDSNSDSWTFKVSTCLFPFSFLGKWVIWTLSC